MSLGDRGFRDSTENYCDSYIWNINGSSATGVLGQAISQPIAVFGISVTLNAAVGSGDFSLVDASSTGDTTPVLWKVTVSSGSAAGYRYDFPFPRGLAFNNGLVLSAATVTGTICVLLKARYS